MLNFIAPSPSNRIYFLTQCIFKGFFHYSIYLYLTASDLVNTVSIALLGTAIRWAPVAHSNWTGSSTIPECDPQTGKHWSKHLVNTQRWLFFLFRTRISITLPKLPLRRVKTSLMQSLAIGTRTTTSLLWAPYFSERNLSHSQPLKLPDYQTLTFTALLSALSPAEAPTAQMESFFPLLWV